MLILLSFFGALATLVSIAFFIVVNIVRKDFLPSFLHHKGKINTLAVVLLGFGLLGIFANGLFLYAERGYSYFIQYPTGQQVAALKPGFHLKLFGESDQWKKVLTISFAKEKTETTGYSPPYRVRFNDAVNADVQGSFRISLPEDPDKFIKMAVEFRTQENLVKSSLAPVVTEVLRNSARTISAQEYIAGKGGEFEYAVRDQLENGLYRLETMEVETEIDTQTDVSGVKGSAFVKERSSKIVKVKIKRDSNGSPLRNIHAFNNYGIGITQATISDVDTDKAFDDKLVEQRNAAAEANIAKQKAVQAKYKKEQIIAEGETQKAETRVAQEKDQIEILVKAESEREKAKVEEEKNAIALRAAKLKAEEIRTLADAEAYKKQKIMSADGALEKRLEAIVEIARINAEALGKHKQVPDVVIGETKGGNNQSFLVDLITAQYAQKIGLTPNKLQPTEK